MSAIQIREVEETQIPAREHVKFYQVGSFAVGNRLAEVDYRSVQSNPDRWNTLTSGHRACQGCGEALGARYALDSAAEAANGNLVTVNATGCLEVFSTPYPESAWTVPWIHSLFGNAPAVAAGAAAGLRAQGKTARVVAQGGDGGTVDIGMGCLSGMFERNDDVLYICYDNEAYMNTGVQRSGATPPAARTATTQPVGPEPGNQFGEGKNMPRIAMAHEIPYVATATVADLRDLEYKVKKAMEIRGARYIHVLVPCPLGWGSASNLTIKLARLATQTGLFPVFEAENGDITSVTKIRRPVGVEEYLRPQRRFAHLFKKGGEAEVIARLQAIADRNIRRYDLIELDQLDEDVQDRIKAAPEDPEGRFTQASQARKATAETKQAQASEGSETADSVIESTKVRPIAESFTEQTSQTQGSSTVKAGSGVEDAATTQSARTGSDVDAGDLPKENH